MDRVEVERDRRDHCGCVQHDERKRRRGERTIGLDAVTRDQREADAEQQVDEADDRNPATLPRGHSTAA